MAIKLDPIVLDRKSANRLAKEYAPVAVESKALITQRNVGMNEKALAAIDTGLHETYVALGEGKKVIDIRQVFTDAGQDDNLRPKIAIARADWRGVGLTRYQDGRLRFVDPTVDPKNVPYGFVNKIYDLPADTLPAMRNFDFIAGAMVPTVPPKVRPDALENFALLWEVYDWKGTPRPLPSMFSIFKQRFTDAAISASDRLATLDPILLRPLGGPLYVVIAAWDLSPIEATILGAI